MIYLLAETASSSGASAAANAGPFGPLVLAVTCAMTALSLILVQVLRGWKKWKPVGEFYPGGAVRIASLCAAAAMVLAFNFLRTPETVKTLSWTLVIGVVGSLLSLVAYNILYARWIFKHMQGVDATGKLVTEDIVGGFLTPESKTQLNGKVTEQMLVDGSNGNLDLVWRRGSRGIVASFFLIAFTALVTFASLAATSLGLFTLLLTPAASVISK